MNVLQLDRNDLLRMILLGCFGFLVVYLVRCIREKKQPPLMTLRNAAWLMFCVYGAALLSLTGITVFLTDPGSVVWQNPLRGFDTTPFDGHVFLPILQNFLLFVPLGFLLPSVSPKAHWRLGTAALCWLLLYTAWELCAIRSL